MAMRDENGEFQPCAYAGPMFRDLVPAGSA